MRTPLHFKASDTGIRKRLAAFSAYHDRAVQSPSWPFARIRQGVPGRSASRRSKPMQPQLLRFASNDYLGLSRHPRTKAALLAAWEQYGSGTAGSPLLGGRYEICRELEKELAQLHGMEDALVLSSTYAANLAVLQGLLSARDTALLDQLSHTSIRDGAKLAGCTTMLFRHNDVSDLQRRLDNLDPSRCLIFVDSVYSMEGAFARVSEIAKTARKTGALLAIDEAHAVGVVGKRGEGVVRALGLHRQVDIITGSLGKSLAAHGGYVASSRTICAFLRYAAHSYVFSSGLSPINAAVALEALVLLKRGKELHKLQRNIEHVRQLFAQHGLPVPKDRTGILPIHVGNEAATLAMSSALENAGLSVSPSIFPAVPKGKGMLRVSISALHRKRDLARAVATLARVVQPMDPRVAKRTDSV